MTPSPVESRPDDRSYSTAPRSLRCLSIVSKTFSIRGPKDDFAMSCANVVHTISFSQRRIQFIALMTRILVCVFFSCVLAFLVMETPVSYFSF